MAAERAAQRLRDTASSASPSPRTEDPAQQQHVWLLVIHREDSHLLKSLLVVLHPLR